MQMLTLNEVAARLGVCRRTAEVLLAEGRLPPPVRFGRVRRWSDAQIDQFIQEEIDRVAGTPSPVPPQQPRSGRGRPRNNK